MAKHDCTCIARVTLNAQPAKLSNRQRDYVHHQAKAEAYEHMLSRLNSRITCDKPAPLLVAPKQSFVSALYSRVKEYLCPKDSYQQ